MEEIIGALVVGYVLTLFHLDEYFIKGVYEFAGIEITLAGYYLAMFVLGAVLAIIKANKG